MNRGKMRLETTPNVGLRRLTTFTAGQHGSAALLCPETYIYPGLEILFLGIFPLHGRLLRTGIIILSDCF